MQTDTKEKANAQAEGQENESPGDIWADMQEHGKGFVKAKLDYIKLAAIEGVSQGIAAAVSGILMALFGLFFLIFASVGLALWIGTLVDSTFLGFLIVGGIYLALTLLILFIKGSAIHKPIINALITKLANPGDEESKKNN